MIIYIICYDIYFTIYIYIYIYFGTQNNKGCAIDCYEMGMRNAACSTAAVPQQTNEYTTLSKRDADTPSSVRMPYKMRHGAFQFGPSPTGLVQH